MTPAHPPASTGHREGNGGTTVEWLGPAEEKLVPTRPAPPPAPPGPAVAQGRLAQGSHGTRSGPGASLVLTAHDLHLLKSPFAWPLPTRAHWGRRPASFLH